MIEESEKSPLAVLAVIIISLLAYNFLTLRDQINEESLSAHPIQTAEYAD